MDKSEVEIVLAGNEAALLVGALFALAEWRFEKPGARVLLNDTLRKHAQVMSESVSARWRARLRQAGLWESPTGYWTRELMERRGRISDGLVIDNAEAALAIAALDIVEHEFSGDWDEFCTVVPGSIDWYPLIPDDLGRLRRRLEAMR